MLPYWKYCVGMSCLRMKKKHWDQQKMWFFCGKCCGQGCRVIWDCSTTGCSDGPEMVLLERMDLEPRNKSNIKCSRTIWSLSPTHACSLSPAYSSNSSNTGPLVPVRALCCAGTSQEHIRNGASW